MQYEGDEDLHFFSAKGVFIYIFHLRYSAACLLDRRTSQSCPADPPGEQAGQAGTGTELASQSPAAGPLPCPGAGWWCGGCGRSAGSPPRPTRSPWRAPVTVPAGQHSWRGRSEKFPAG